MISVFKFQLKIARIFFIIAALYGLFLRVAHIVYIPISYKKIMEAHSHVAFLGWGFLAVLSLIGLVFIPKEEKTQKLKMIFNVLAVILAIMLVSFTFLGYKSLSIILLSIFLITSYVYLILLLNKITGEQSYSSKFLRTGVFYYFLSSLAVWSIPLIINYFGKTIQYHNAIYFYLHFLYNGFFVFALFGLLIRYFENKSLNLQTNAIKQLYLFTHLACIPAYALSMTWSTSSKVIIAIGFIAALLQLLTLKPLFTLFSEILVSTVSKQIKYIAKLVLFFYCTKLLMQFLSAFPIVIKIATQLKPYFIIGYLHLFTLGFMSLFIILLVSLNSKKLFSVLGVKLLTLGVIFSECILFLQGVLVYFDLGLPWYNWMLFIFSAMMPIGLLIIHFSNKKVIY